MVVTKKFAAIQKKKRVFNLLANGSCQIVGQLKKL